jgi:hypothetical protein
VVLDAIVATASKESYGDTLRRSCDAAQLRADAARLPRTTDKVNAHCFSLPSGWRTRLPVPRKTHTSCELMVFAATCPVCDDKGWVCETHLDRPWGFFFEELTAVNAASAIAA